uniref:ATP-binding cassette sub-family B member 9-like n=1 Tax=Styela clava TaxID=7725 RepID=UPI00193A6664|nr:ATP-binding cassette sub-family B member 9-like [Styela clava]
MMALKQVFAGTFALLDVAAICFILGHGINFYKYELINRLGDVKFATTGLDFFILSILRAMVLIITIIIISTSSRKKRINNPESYIHIASVMSVAYLLIKLLIYSETEDFLKNLGNVQWFWLQFGWSIFATGITSFIFRKLMNGTKCIIDLEDEFKFSKKGKNEESVPLINWTVDADPLSADKQDSSSSGKSSKDPSDSEDTSSTKEKKKKKKGFSEHARKATASKMLSYAKKDMPVLFLAFIFLISAALAETFIPLFTGRVISVIAIEHNQEKFTQNIIIMIGITVIASTCAGMRGGLMVLANTRFNMRIRNLLFTSLVKQEVGFFEVTRTGEILSRLTSDTTTMSNMIGSNVNIFLRNVVKGIGTCVFMFSLSWRLSLITFIVLPIVVGIARLYGSYYKKLQRHVQDAYAYANEVAEEVISTIKTVRSFANESGENIRYNERMDLVYRIRQKQALAYGGFMLSSELNKLALVTLTLWYGGHLVLTDLMNSGDLISFILYQITLGTCMSSIGNVFSGLMQALGAAEKVFQMIEREPKIDIKKGDYAPNNFEGHISFENVTFAYPSRPGQPILKNVSFEAPAGKVTALVGPSGGGKSSCVNLLQHFYECMSGNIKVDGTAIEKYSHKYFHKKVSMVGQEPVLYARSIKENIAYGLNDSEYAMGDVVEAARKANAHSFITELTQQYLTETGEKGTQLSGGQKQRVAIARALIRNPKILILDEATSALDAESEYLVQQALQNTMKDRTVIVIAHRLTTVESADKIVVIDKGEVVEEGPPAELMKKSSGLYYKLVKRQMHSPKRRRKASEKIHKE